MRHPNAAAGLVGGAGLGSLVAYLLNLFGIHFSDPEAYTAIAGGVSAFVLYIGRHGVLGLWQLILHGGGGRSH